MALSVDDFVRDASGILRTFSSPLEGAYVLFGLMTLKLEDRHLEVVLAQQSPMGKY